MKAEKLDRRIELRHRVLTPDATTGEQVEGWPTAYATPWARKVPQSSRRFFAAQQMNAELSELFEIRYRADVLATDRIYFGGVLYRISPPAEIGRREGLEIQAVAVKS